ncbi:GNAT family N-acetyltransferase [Streptomyces violaceusniger]|uniref:N-acetyltransferase n=1 Tax=Streptomyces violaceusniger TaxID=68280 RepID=A0A4D4LEZ8_STRVO|nr:N-acetyltransferase [Streptomyces violaceusniger]
MSDIRVRTARAHEYERIAALTVEGFRSRNSAPRPERLALLRDTPGRAAAGDLLVAVDEPGGTLIGTATLLRPGTAYARLALPDEAELRLLAVLPEHRGRGVGGALLAEGVERARSRGMRALVLDTGRDNVVSQRVYQRLGFARQYAREERENRHRPVKTAVFSHDLGQGRA